MQITDEYVSSQIATGKQYILVFLIAGPNYESYPSELLDENHRAHLRHLFTLKSEQKLLINGPLGKENKRIRGLSIYNSSSIEEVQTWVEADPAVIAGRFTYEIYPWFGIPGGTLL